MNRFFAACALSLFAGPALAQHVETLNGTQPVRSEPNDRAPVMFDPRSAMGRAQATIGHCTHADDHVEWCPILSGS